MKKIVKCICLTLSVLMVFSLLVGFTASAEQEDTVLLWTFDQDLTFEEVQQFHFEWKIFGWGGLSPPENYLTVNGGQAHIGPLTLPPITGGDNTFCFRLQQFGYPEGYAPGETDLTLHDFDSVALWIDTSEIEVEEIFQIRISFLGANDDYRKLSPDKPVHLYPDGGKKDTITTVAHDGDGEVDAGRIELPAGFVGYVVVPFDSCQNEWKDNELLDPPDENYWRQSRVHAVFEFYGDEKEFKFVHIDNIQVLRNNAAPWGWEGDDEPDIILGDVNLDGEVTSIDALLVLSHISERKLLEGDSLIAADMNKNGEITSQDALQILKEVARK